MTCQCDVWDGLRRLTTGHSVARQQTIAIVRVPIRQALAMMKVILTRNLAYDNEGPNSRLAYSYAVFFYQYKLDGPRMIFTRPLQHRALLHWYGGVHYRHDLKKSLDMLELVRTIWSKLEIDTQQQNSDSGLLHRLFARSIANDWRNTNSVTNRATSPRRM